MPRSRVRPGERSGARPGPVTHGLRAITVRRVCLGLTLLGVVGNGVYHPSLNGLLFSWIVLLVYGGLIAGAVQQLSRRVRVGRVETTVMIGGTGLFVLAVLLAPRSWSVDAVRTGHALDGSSYSIPVRYERYGSPLLSLFGRPPSTGPGPWLGVAAGLAVLAALTVCLQWMLVFRLGTRRRGALNDAVGPAGLSSAETLPAPLGTSITRPVDARTWSAGVIRPPRRRRDGRTGGAPDGPV